MSELDTAPGRDHTPAESGPRIFGSDGASERGGLPPAVWAVAALIVLVVVGALVVVGRKKPAATPNTLQPEDAYAATLPLTQLAMSESESLSGTKVTYLDGHIQNTGQKTVSGVTVQVVFGNDEAMPPRIETQPLTLIRTRQPYVDTELVSAEPLKPGDDREFRLIFEAVPQNWNTQMPQVRVIRTDLR
ncbi:MAG: hypothetical protein NVSMB62_11980 [Acidobacteriaceae bacterium]